MPSTDTAVVTTGTGTEPEAAGPSGNAGSVLIDGVSKSFRKQTSLKRSYSTLKSELLGRLLGRRGREPNLIQALREVTVAVPPGSAIGVIGRNGSGKSTLLKLIAGIYRPDRGAVRVNGRVSALIELGAGFHPDFTGRENIYLGGAMYGLSRREVSRRLDTIVAFAELEEFIDDPVRTYSSGMYMRLGFSVAVHTDPDILLVDEVLAVGDAAFINRCHDKISELRRRGKTLILVTHDLHSVLRWCDEALWLERGRVKKRGEPRQVIDSYLQEIDAGRQRELSGHNAPEPAPAPATDAVEQQEQHRWGSGAVEILTVRMCGGDGADRWLFRSGEQAVVEVQYEIKQPVEELVFGVGILRADGFVVYGINTALDGLNAPLPSEALPVRGSYRLTLPRLELAADSYYLDVAAHRRDGAPYDYHHLLYKFAVQSQNGHHGVYAPEHCWAFDPHYSVRREGER